MSLFKEASLVMIPSGVKDGTLYSVKPTDGAGDFTFTRGSNLAATRVDENGLIEKGRENLLLQSNQFDTTWISIGTTETGGQSGYDGSNNAWRLDTTAAGSAISQNVTSTGVQTFSIKLKQGTLGWASVQVTGTASVFVYFDLINGVKGNIGSGILNSNITSVGNGYYLCSITFNGSAGATRVFPAVGNGDVSATSGNIYIQDAQLEVGLVATDYIETGATTAKAGILEDLPRLNYDGSCPSLLLEPTRTNLFPQSEYFNGSDWNKSNITIEDNLIVSPDGFANSSKLKETQDASSVSHQIFDAFNASINQIYTLSFFAKKNGRDIGVGMASGVFGVNATHFDLTNGTVLSTTAESAGIHDYGNGWYRCYVTNTANSTASAECYIILSNNEDFTYQGDGSSGVYLYGAQVEAGSYATSYIPTYGAAVTRTVDLCYGAGDATTFNDSEGVIFLDLKRTNGDATKRRTALTDGVNTVPYIIIEYLANNSVKCEIYDGTTASGVITSSILTNERNKVAYSYKENEFKLFINGVQSGSTVTSGSVLPSGTLAALSMTNGVTSTDPLKGNVNKLIYFPVSLTDAELAALTT